MTPSLRQAAMTHGGGWLIASSFFSIGHEHDEKRSVTRQDRDRALRQQSRVLWSR